MTYIKENFGSLISGEHIFLHTISNDKLICSISEYGACITSLIVKDRQCQDVDVVAGFDNVKAYEGKCGSMGFTIGRHANRIANAEFELEGKKYYLVKNNGKNHLHGGTEKCFSKKIFKIKHENLNGNETLICSIISSDGEEGYPGNLKLDVIFSIIDSKLRIEYKAKTDQTTIINITNHSYFNLEGNGSKNVFDHILQVNADHTTEVGDGLIPTGKLNNVTGTVFDLRKPQNIGDVLSKRNDDPQMKLGGGLDHNFCLNNKGKNELAAILYSPKTGIEMKTYTDQPGVQVYTACTTDIPGGKNSSHYGKFSCVCLETQHYPDSIHHDNFPSIVLNKDKEFYSITEYSFDIK